MTPVEHPLPPHGVLGRLIAILRGIQPAEVESICAVLVAAGFTTIEIPLNSPDALHSIALAQASFGHQVLIGAGTVLSSACVDAVHGTGARLIVSPDCNPRVIRRAKEQGMLCVPGVFTPSEAFAALEAGADALKMFPANALGAATLAAWVSVLPPGTAVYPVGGISPASMEEYLRAGARGFGLGKALYQAGDTPAAVERNARAFLEAMGRAGQT